MSEGALPSDDEIIRYMVDQGYGRDIQYIVEQTGIPYGEVVDHFKRMGVLDAS
jgi:hypothetical protein